MQAAKNTKLARTAQKGAQPSLAAEVAPLNTLAKQQFTREGFKQLNDKLTAPYTDVTKGGSIRNIETDLTREGLGRKLENEGFIKDERGSSKNITFYSKENLKYTLRDDAKSTGGPTADVTLDGKPTMKIRLREGD